jgi:hypothetical protein
MKSKYILLPEGPAFSTGRRPVFRNVKSYLHLKNRGHPILKAGSSGILTRLASSTRKI